MKIEKENLKLALLALGKNISMSESELLEAIEEKLNPRVKVKSKPRVYRRTELPEILGISLRAVDRLITNIKRNGKIISYAVIPTVQLSKRAVGVLESDLMEYIENCKRVSNV